MNTVVTVASVASASAVAAPSIAPSVAADWPTGTSHAAIRARLEYTADTLEIPRAEVAGLEYDQLDGATTPILDFAKRYEQSLDWLLLGDVGPMLRGRAGRIDAELIELGERLQRAYEQWRPLSIEEDRLLWKAHEVAHERMGLQPDQPFASEAQAKKFVEELGRAESDVGYREVEQQIRPLSSEIDSLTKRIEATPAHTIRGLGAKALIAMFANEEFWERPTEDLDWGQRQTRVLIETVCALTGVTPIEGRSNEEHAEAPAPSFAKAYEQNRELLEAYSEWLFYERRLLNMQIYPNSENAERYVPCTRANNFHFPMWPKSWNDLPQPSSRAALVLGTVGVKLRVDEDGNEVM